MAQPPGMETSASPKRASSGPSTRMDARMVLTNSYGARKSVMVLVSASMVILSPTTKFTPMRPRSSMVVVMSCRCGTLPIIIGLSARMDATNTGKAAFLAPDTHISPRRGVPPVMSNLSIMRWQQTPAWWVKTSR